MKVLVTGATGYIGGRLAPRLLDAGYDVRCMARDPKRLTLDPWWSEAEVVQGDALDPAGLDAAMQGCDVAYYLIHSMGEVGGFAERDRTAAGNFRDAAERAGLRRIVYLGGLGLDDEELSPHLSSRHDVGRVLASGPVPVTELRAAVIIGSGSVSFEMIRHLSEVLPIIMRPKWVRTRCQPIAVRNVLEILIAAIEETTDESHIYEIGGPDVLTYQQMIQHYADVAGLRRRIVLPLPIFSKRLSPGFVGLVTPLPIEIIRPLIASLLHDVVVTRETPPGFEPERLIPYKEAVRRALYRIEHLEVETRWSDAVNDPAAPLPTDPKWAQARRIENVQRVRCATTPDEVFEMVQRIGGDTGYYAMNWAWSVRGWIDKLIGGVGLRRGRRHPIDLRPGESLDFFRVALIEPDAHRLLLRAEMKVPGTAWLGWEVRSDPAGCELIQTATFVPRGLVGRAYWWALLPFHAPIFRLMAHNIVRAAERSRPPRRLKLHRSKSVIAEV